MNKNIIDEKHPSFPQPENLDVPIWRYLDHKKFEWLVTNRRLYMTGAKHFLDTLEGTAPQGEHAHWLNQIKQENGLILNNMILDNYFKIERFGNTFKNSYFVSCWHMNNELNARMWDEYTTTTESVAIKSTYKALLNCLPCARIGLVRYIDYSKDRLPTYNMFERIMHKNKEDFDWEQEVRAVFNPKLTINVYSQQLHKNLKGEICFIPEVNLEELIHEIHFHPNATREYKTLVEAMLKDLKSFVLKSDYWFNPRINKKSKIISQQFHVYVNN
jgi:hypothetical protein